MSSNNLNGKRTRVRERLFFTHMTRHGYRCDCCGNDKGKDMHEIFPRRLTPDGSEAREASYQLELVALLCRECHMLCADVRDAQDFYLKNNIRRYGLKAVQGAYDRLCACLVNDPGVDLEAISKTVIPNPCRKTGEHR